MPGGSHKQGKGGVLGWFGRHVPTREQLERNRFIKPFAHRILHSELWRFTRRSVPRGVALGLFVGIFLLVPGVQIAGAALLALPVRANVPLGIAMTFLSNPATTPLILALSLYIGNAMLGRSADVSRVMSMIEHHASVRQWASWLFSDAAPALVFGLFAVAVVSAAVGYLVSGWIWQAHVARKWRARQHRHAEAQHDTPRVLPG